MECGHHKEIVNTVLENDKELLRLGKILESRLPQDIVEGMETYIGALDENIKQQRVKEISWILPEESFKNVLFMIALSEITMALSHILVISLREGVDEIELHLGEVVRKQKDGKKLIHPARGFAKHISSYTGLPINFCFTIWQQIVGMIFDGTFVPGGIRVLPLSEYSRRLNFEFVDPPSH